jgi:predicted nucleic acid-binding protein
VIVADASAVVDLLTREPNAPKIAGLLAAEQAHAPDLIGFEVLSAIRGLVRGSKLSPADGLTAMRDFEGLGSRFELWPLLETMSDCAIELRENLTAYDASYVALAQNLGCALVTTDGRLARAVGRRVDVTLV